MMYPPTTDLYEASQLCDLTELLRHIHTRETALPDFQRDFVWDPPMVRELLVTLAYNHAAGTVWRIRNTQRVFAWREFQGAPALAGRQPTFLILDGQQRLTSLYRAFYGIGAHRYYVNLGRLLKGVDFEDCVFYLGVTTVQARAYEALERQAQDLVLPLPILQGGIGAFARWSRQVARTQTSDLERDALEDALSELAEAWVRPLDAYQFPVVTLAETAGVEAVCRMFEKLNGTGVKLGPFELLTARFWPQDISLRHLWLKARGDYPILAEYAIDPYCILQIISLVTSSPPLCTLKNVLHTQASTIEAWWNTAVENLAKGLEILRDDCGVVGPKWFPYKTVLIPLAAVLAKRPRPGGPEAGAIRQKLVRWFWCAVFGQTYDQGSNTQAAKDVVELLAWFAGGEPPQSVSGFQFDSRILRDATPHQGGLYRGTMCLILSRGPRDVHSGAKLTGDLIAQHRIDAHHVFPRAFLDRHGVPARLRDCVLNRALLDRTTNQFLQTRAPADYLSQLRTTVDAEKLRELLQSHLLPDAPDASGWGHDFETFLARRQEILWQAIQRVTGLAHTPSKTEDHARLPLRTRARGAKPPMPVAHEGARGSVAQPRMLPGLKGYLAWQSPRTRHLWEALDTGICALAPDITAQTTRGRRCVGGVSYYTPERLFFCADFIEAGDGLTLSVFTGGQRWEGLHLARSVPRGYAVIRTEADLPQALAWAKAAYEARKQVP